MDDPKLHLHWLGWWNKLCRFYFYLCRGNDVVAQFHTLIISVLGIFFVFKLKSIFLFFVTLLIVIPILICLGWLFVHKVNKILDWLGIKFSSYGSNRNLELLEEIRDLLKYLKEKK